MTLRAADLRALVVKFGQQTHANDDGSWMVAIRSPRCAINLIWAATEDRVREVLDRNPRIKELHTAVFPSTGGWAVGIVSDELLSDDKEDLANEATYVMALCADIPELAEIKAAVVDNAAQDLAAGQLHDDIAAGKLPPIGRAG